MNHGKPVFAATDKNTDVGKIILNGEFGWWCESNDVYRYESILDEICSNPKVIEQKGKLSRKFLEEHFDTKIAYDRIINAYNKCTDKVGRN